MGVLGVAMTQSGSEIKVDLKSRLLDRILHLLGLMIPGASLAVVLGALTLLRQQPHDGFSVLRQWGAWWMVVIAAGYWIWTLAMRIIDLVGSKLDKLAIGMQDSAVAIARLADRDDRERDRMITETAYIGQKMTRMSEAMERIETMLKDQGERG